jgi:hypothetical protein
MRSRPIFFEGSYRILELLGESQIGWRTVFESGNIEATRVTVRGDLAVTAWLASTVSADMDILGAESGLPALPAFAITLQMTPGAGPIAQEFARYVRDAMSRWRSVAPMPPESGSISVHPATREG